MAGTVVAVWLAIIPGMVIQAASATYEQVPKPQGHFKSNDTQLRELATASPAPEYPRTSLAKKIAGVAVADVLFDRTGAAEAVHLLQSPDAETGHAVRDAVMQWRIRPLMGLPRQGILVFYFHLKGAEGVVLSPAEMRRLISPGARDVKREDEPPAKQIEESELRGLSTGSNAVLLDIRDRETFAEGHEKGAVNIPFEELLTRGPAELPVSRPVVLDCRDPPELCAMAVHWLAASGFTQLFVVHR